jgi:small-conductance mechanosensitive channel
LRNLVPSASITSFGESSLNFSLHVYVPDPSLGGRVKHRLSTQIQRKFQEAGIAMPMPGRELHVRTVPTELMPMLPSSSPQARLDRASPTPPAPRVAAAPVTTAPEETHTRCVDE